MKIYSMKLTVQRVVAGLLAVGAVACGAVALVSARAEPDTVGVAVSTIDKALMDVKVKDNESRVALLEELGWKVSDEPRIEREVQIPKVFDETYEAYNALQLAQGLDLMRYQGKRATLYTYELLEYPSGETGVVANLLVRRGKLLAADISSAESDGFIHGIVQDLQSAPENANGVE